MLFVLMLAVATPAPAADAVIEGAEATRTLENIIGPKPTDEDLAASMQRIFDSAPSDADAEQADRNVQDAIRRYIAKRDREPMQIPDLALPQATVAKENPTGALLPSMMRQSTLPLPASPPPDFWQRNRWAWPTVQWLTFLSLIGLCIVAARWGRRPAPVK